MESYKLIVLKNDKPMVYMFTAPDEETKMEMLKQWKYDNLTTYDRVIVDFLGTCDEHKLIVGKVCSPFVRIQKSKFWLYTYKLQCFGVRIQKLRINASKRRKVKLYL